MLDPQRELTSVLSEEAVVPVGPSETAQLLLDETEVAVQQVSQWALVWYRFKRHKLALVGAGVLILFIIVAIIGPYISPETPLSYNPLAGNKPPQLNYRYILGTDAFGHSVMMDVLYGARISMEVGLFAALSTSILGILIGAVSGYFGGWIDTIGMRVTDVFLTLPFVPLLILLSDYVGSGNVWFIIAIFAFVSWPGVARLVRSYYLSFRQQEFVEAARAVGASDVRIIFRHILPNALSVVIVATTLNIANFIITEAAIDFLGVGIHPPQVSWGLALADAQDYLTVGNWWWALFPGLALLITVLAANFMGDGLRDALDVRAKIME
jgi:peptide/nickel transport system permease protein